MLTRRRAEIRACRRSGFFLTFSAAVANEKKGESEAIYPDHRVGQGPTQCRDDVIGADVNLALHGLFGRTVNDQVIFLVLELAELKLNICKFASYFHFK